MNETQERPIVTLWDGRRGYFYLSHFTGVPLFQPVNEEGEDEGKPELSDSEDHELQDES